MIKEQKTYLHIEMPAELKTQFARLVRSRLSTLSLYARHLIEREVENAKMKNTDGK